MRSTVYKILLALAAAVILCCCGLDEPAPAPFSTDNVIKVAGRMTPFAETNPDTKSTKNQYETAVKNMAMFVFDSDGNKVDYQITNNSQPLFLIDRNDESYKTHTQSKMDKCKIYILANIPAADQTILTGITTEAGFLATDCTISNVIRTSEISDYGGLPMWGAISQSSTGGDIDLRADADPEHPTNPLIGQVLTIPLTCMMSKLTFNVTVDPIQKSDYIQRFELKSWTVENVPADVQVAQPTGTNESAHADSGPFLGAVTFGQVDNGVNPIMQGGSTAMTFCCYVPEHRVLPTGTCTYPEGVTAGDEVSQNFKPDWLGDNDKPLKITLNGVYTDHRNLEKEVTYTIYPGANNYNDFFVERNHEYIHNISIKGISNSKDGNPATISVDLRVDVEQNDFKFELERETLLDSHWEIRPIRITLDPTLHPKADHIEVEIMNASSTPWIRFEAPTATQISSHLSDYCDVSSDALAYGKRRYFTTDLVTNTLSDSTSVSFKADPNNVEHTIWVYIDENVTGAPTSGSNTRQAQVQCRYYEKNQTSPTVTENYYFIQKSLHNITQNGHTYGIEYYEEYLYNFDSRDDFTSLPDGMAWGLNGEQLSYEDRALYCSGGWFDDIINSSVIPSINQDLRVYDFYLSTAESADGTIGHPFSGHRFTRRIADKVGVGALATNASASSAVEYCVNKNKRSSETGKVGEVLWYLPAIDEMEEICKGGYSDFEVFQNKYYWSSQPSYQVYNWSYTGPLGAYLGDYYEGQMYLDNKSRARATKVANDFSVVMSGQNPESAQYKYTINRERLNDAPTVTGPTATGNTPIYEPGNQLRSTVNRIRCAYRVLKSYTSTFGFEASTSEGIWTSSDFSRNTGTKRTGTASGSFSVSSGWTSATGTATVVTAQYLYAPGQLSFYVRYSGDKPDSSTWTVSISADNSNWTQVSSYTTLSTSFSQVSVDLSAYQDVYVRIQNSTRVPGAFAGNTTNLFIDDIQFTYTD